MLRTWLGILLLPFLLVNLWSPAQARQQAASAQQVIDAVNALRLSRGLAAYTVDSGLMAYAQQHAEYQASIDTSTHLHSDGSVSLSDGIQENVAAGTAEWITAEIIVYQIWSDAGHMAPMVGNASGSLGVGMAISGDTAYYTLNVRGSGDSLQQQATATRPPGMVGTAPVYTETPIIPIVPLVTSTPLADGAIYHEVGYGQTLWDIALAYEVTLEEIRAMNNMAPDSTDIYAGQKLLIRLPGTPYATPTSAETADEAGEAEATQTPRPTQTRTPTPRPTKALEALLATQTVTPTAQASADFSIERYRVPLAYGLLALAGIGLVLWLVQFLVESKRSK